MEYTLSVMEIRDSLARIHDRIEKAALDCGRNPGEIRLVAVSKRFPAEKVIKAHECGQVLFGENQVQEARDKISLLEDREIEWHLIGHLQSNKARIAAQCFDCIQTVDRPRIARKLDSLAAEFERTLEVFMQVNVGGEDQKSGVEPDSAEDLLSVIDECQHLRLRGLMTIPPYTEDPEDARTFFSSLREIRDTLNQGRDVPLRELSMGMSHDFEVAIQEGATIIRVGSAIFGQRPPLRGAR